MKFKNLSPMIWTNELRATVDFYKKQLGFQGELREEWGWAALSRDGVELMIALPNAHSKFVKPLFTGSFYIRLDDVDALWAELKDRVTIAYPIEDFDYGMREFAVYDNNGYMLQFGSPKAA